MEPVKRPALWSGGRDPCRLSGIRGLTSAVQSMPSQSPMLPTARDMLTDLVRPPANSDGAETRDSSVLPNGDSVRSSEGISGCIRVLAPAELPRWARSLLVHDRDMTSTLEAFHGSSIHIRTLARDESRGVLVRQVVLETESNEAVEFGAIRIHLDRFDAEPRELIESSVVPLGGVLERFGIAYSCRPSRYFETVDASLSGPIFGAEDAVPLYGRQNTSFDPGGRVIAEVVEVLAPPKD